MSYVDSNLTKNEVIVKKMERNSMPLIGAWIVGILFCWLLLIPTFKAIKKTIVFKNTEVAITNKRIIGKGGVVATGSLDVPLNKIQNASVSYSFWGKIFNCGFIEISSAADKLKVGYVKNAEAFKGAIMAQVDQYEEDRMKEQAAQMASAMAGVLNK